MTSPALTLLSPVRPEPAPADSAAQLRSVLSAAQQSGLLPAASQPRPATAVAQPILPAAVSRSSTRSLSPAFRRGQRMAKPVLFCHHRDVKYSLSRNCIWGVTERSRCLKLSFVGHHVGLTVAHLAQACDQLYRVEDVMGSPCVAQQYGGFERSGSLPPEVKAGPSPPPVSPLPWQSLRGVRHAPAPLSGSVRPSTARTPALVDRTPSGCVALTP